MNLFQPYTLPSGLQVKNRLVFAPMTTYSSNADGTISEGELEYLRRRSKAGWGIMVSAACYVHASGIGFAGQFGADSDALIPSLKATADAIHSGGALAYLQLYHGGRMSPASAVGTPLSASAVRVDREGAETPRPMTKDEINEVVQAFGEAARRAKLAGFDGVEIHGANTYLLQQFVSPMTNLRNDEYGEDRYLFSCQVVESVLAAVGPNFSVGYRYSTEEAEPNGLKLGHTEELIERLLKYPLDYHHLSLRNLLQAPVHADESTEKVLPRLLRKIDGRTATIAAGGVLTGLDASTGLEAGLDFVAVGKAALSEPEWPLRVMNGEPIEDSITTVNGSELLSLPEGLYQKILNVPGWFKLKEEASV